MKPLKIRISMFIISLFILGCERYNSPVYPFDKNEVFAKTNQTFYSPGDSIKFNIQNNSESNIFLLHFGPYFIYNIEMETANGWLIYYSPVILAIYGPSYDNIEPDNNYSDAIIISKKGTYRIVIPFLWNIENVNEDILYSNNFVIQ